MEYILRGGPISDDNKINYNSIGSLFLDHLRKAQDKVLYIIGETSEQLTASQILVQSGILANRLLKLGIKSGDVIGIHSENRFEYIYVVVAAFSIGAVVTLFSVSYKEGELTHVIDLAKPKLIFTSRPQSLINVTSMRPFVENVIVFDKDDSLLNWESYSQFIKNTSPLEVFPCESNFDCMDNVVLISYSSGTTGSPKGVLLTQRNLFGYLERKSIFQGRALCFTPWNHVYGFGLIMLTLTSYDNSVFLKRFEERLFLDCIQKYKINLIFGVPATVAFLAKSPLTKEYDLTSIKIVYSGAAPLSQELVKMIKSKYNASVRVGYGLTETTAGVTRQTDLKCAPGSVGGLTFDTLGKVVDNETGNSLGPNKVGELCFKASVIMKGYLGNEAATNEIIDKDGWIHTGDIGYYDENEEWFVVDRIKDLIKYKGFQVAPVELENVLLSNSKVMDAACIGIPNEIAGELPVAFVILKPGKVATEREIQDYVAGKVSSPKHLRGGVRFVDSIPRNPAGKILRKNLREIIRNTKSKL